MSDLNEPKAVLITPVEKENNLEQLIEIGLEALKFSPPLYIKSIFGSVCQWLPPHSEHSEFNILDLWKPISSLNYLKDVSVPAFSHAPNRWFRTFLPPVVQSFFWRPSNYFQQSDPFDGVSSFANEHWFFVNGVATNETVARMNSDFLSQMFMRPITAVHNSTDSLLLDLVQCAIGKQFKTRPNLSRPQTMTEPAVKATVAILDALIDPEKDKVVVISHSQGTIITANVIRALKVALLKLCPGELVSPENTEAELTLLDQLAIDVLGAYAKENEDKGDASQVLIELLKKLEVYTFANCANKMTYLTHVHDSEGNKVGLPYIENFANEFDLVARLGVLSPFKESRPEIIKLDGPVFEKTGRKAWGHLLNQHYLLGMDAFLKEPDSKPNPYVYQAGSSPEQSTPRLYQYFGGKRLQPYCGG